MPQSRTGRLLLLGVILAGLLLAGVPSLYFSQMTINLVQAQSAPAPLDPSDFKVALTTTDGNSAVAWIRNQSPYTVHLDAISPVDPGGTRVGHADLPSFSEIQIADTRMISDEIFFVAGTPDDLVYLGKLGFEYPSVTEPYTLELGLDPRPDKFTHSNWGVGNHSGKSVGIIVLHSDGRQIWRGIVENNSTQTGDDTNPQEGKYSFYLDDGTNDGKGTFIGAMSYGLRTANLTASPQFVPMVQQLNILPPPPTPTPADPFRTDKRMLVLPLPAYVIKWVDVPQKP